MSSKLFEITLGTLGVGKRWAIAYFQLFVGIQSELLKHEQWDLPQRLLYFRIRH